MKEGRFLQKKGESDLLKRIEVNNVEEYYFKLVRDLKILEEPEDDFKTFSVSAKMGSGFAKRYKFADGLELNIFDAVFNDSLFYSCLSRMDTCEIFFCARGSYEYGISEKNMNKKVSGGELNSFVNDNYESWIKYPKEERWTNASINFNRDFLKNYLDISGEEIVVDELLDYIGNGMFEKNFFKNDFSKLVRDFEFLINSGETGFFKIIRIESKILEIVADFLEICLKEFSGNPVAKTAIGKKEVLKLEQAKKVIENNINTPLTIKELSDCIGLNTFKLKTGFKEVYGTTIFGYLRNLRMEKAAELMTESEKVIDIAYEVGYSNPSHFAAAFRRKYGINPKEYLKRCKNTF